MRATKPCALLCVRGIVTRRTCGTLSRTLAAALRRAPRHSSRMLWLIEIRLTPAGNLRWETSGDAPEDASLGRLREVFEADWREGLFLLAADKTDCSSSPVLRYWPLKNGGGARDDKVREGQNELHSDVVSSLHISSRSPSARYRKWSMGGLIAVARAGGLHHRYEHLQA